MRNSYFDGGLLSYILSAILAWFITLITFGICAPWDLCIMYRWEIEHTVVDGHRMGFGGTALQLFGNWIKWLLLTLITLGIYSFWVKIKLLEWKTKHTYFVN